MVNKMKISFQEAAINLENICDTVECADEINLEIEKIFIDSMADFKQSIDRRISYIRYAESQVEKAKEMRNSWSDRASKFQAMVDRIKEQTLETILKSPDLPYSGNLGSFRVQKNSQPTIEIADDFENEKYMKVSYAVDKTGIRKALEAGIEVPGASMKFGQHIRIETK